VSRPPIGTDMYSAKLWERLGYKALQPHVGATRCAQTPACGTYISQSKIRGNVWRLVEFQPCHSNPLLRDDRLSLDSSVPLREIRAVGDSNCLRPGIAIFEPDYHGAPFTPRGRQDCWERFHPDFFFHQTGYRARASSLGTGLFVHNGMIFEVSPLIGLPNPFSSATKCLTQASR
jgi:hypothetical protein